MRACEPELRDGVGRRFLDVAPYSPEVYGSFLERRGWQCTRIDKWRSGNPRDPRSVGFIDLEVDLVDMSVFAAASFDVVAVQHVIEEIPEHERALAEIARVLRPGGHALLEIPWNPRQEVSQRQSPDRFGNVWRFGADLPRLLNRCFSHVDVRKLSEGGYRGDLFACAA